MKGRWAALAGGVHDFLAGMISMRMGGGTVVEIVGKYLGRYARYIMLVFSVALLVLVGTVFITSPAPFMSAVSLTYILMANEGLGLSQQIAYPAGVIFAAALFAIFCIKVLPRRTHVGH